MSQEPSKKNHPDNDARFSVVVATVVFLVLFVGAVIVRQIRPDANVGLLFGLLAMFLALNVLMLCQSDDTIQQQKHARREHRRRLARKREIANFEAQLRKPDFETRLRSFTQTGGMNGEDDPESQMEFWERNEEYSRTPARPIELIRYLLQRISKLVGKES